MMTFIPKLVQNLLEILEDNEYYDVIIEVGNDPYVKIFRAHMVILYYRSPYLQRTLSTNKRRDDIILTHIKLPNISPETFQIILRYIYAGNLSLIEYDTLNIIKILVAASELGLQELITNIQSFLIKNKVSWIKQNFNLVYQTCFENDSFSELQNFCTDLITRKPENVFRSIDFNSISEKCLISLIQRDNIQIDDIKVWEHVLKWGIAQNPELPSDLSNYSKDDINILSNTLQRCIPFIKFYNLTSEEFLNKVHPFKLILRGSRDGFSSHKFHKICDGIFNTVSIIRVQGSNEILGGYNPTIWNSIEGYNTTKDSFIFSFKDMYNINNYVLSRVADEKKAIFGSIDFGPTFGSDLTIFGERYYGLSHCDSRFYEKRIRETSYYFSVWEYEIFQIIKN
ncbi:hypothetical protein RclHR1_17420003 [Rhizophagus clarus]|uniref:BTB domain-containing protein n=1 Tax=Rhizophagus clarus TaxID=94130 RepID=A0A2Z6QK16_9GLOM|nr:hypothetical protein RclHR1_17420003 [Rhizophagus clarus]